MRSCPLVDCLEVPCVYERKEREERGEEEEEEETSTSGEGAELREKAMHFRTKASKVISFSIDVQYLFFNM